MSTLHYPAAPVNMQEIRPSAAFKKEVVKVTGSIALFFIVYLLLMVAAVALAVGCFYGGIAIISAFTGLYGILAGVGLMAVGISVLFFLVKFVFSSSKNEDPGRVQVSEHEHPELYSFIRQLAIDTKTQFPKKIFVSPSVNACVFYNSSFWSMFFPVRKNLEIGLGLVNTVNLSEFKAIMAHEFGHFSQQSMKLGSFTYNVNRMIYNMLYENTGYTTFLEGWGKVHGLLSLFAYVTIGIARFIQWILKGMYQLINKQYMGLSRQMEFNADAIAASVAGGNNLVSSLNRLEISNSCFSTALEKADEFIKKNMVSKNIFTNQLNVLQSFAREFELPVRNGLPEVTSHFLQTFSRSRVNYKNQWASHPTNEEREAELLKLDMNAETDTRSPWILFSDTPQLQQKMTRHIYAGVEGSEQMEEYDNDVFEQDMNAVKDKYSLPAVFRKYYNNRFPDVKDWQFDEPVSGQSISNEAISELLSDENCNLPESIQSNENDLQVLKAISEKQIDVKTFDFDGEKYDVTSVDNIIHQLEDEIRVQKEKLAVLDKKIYACLCRRALGDGLDNASSIPQLYRQYGEINSRVSDYFELVNKIVETIAPFYHGGLSLEEVERRVQVLKDDLEIKFKARLKEFLEDPSIANHLSASLKQRMEEFQTKYYYYFLNGEFDNDSLQVLFTLGTDLGSELGDIRFSMFKQVLVKQAEVVA